MARFNEILVGRFNNAIKKLFGMKGGAPSPQAAGEIAPTVSMFYGAECRFLEQWDLFASASNVVGGAGQTGGIRFRNPTGSNVVMVIESLIVTGPLPDLPILSIGFSNADLTTVNAASTGLDVRQKRASTAVISNSVNTAGAGSNIMQAGFPANSNAQFVTTDIGEIPCLPGTVYQITSNVNAQNMVVSWRWRERFLEESERQ